MRSNFPDTTVATRGSEVQLVPAHMKASSNWTSNSLLPRFKKKTINQIVCRESIVQLLQWHCVEELSNMHHNQNGNTWAYAVSVLLWICVAMDTCGEIPCLLHVDVTKQLTCEVHVGYFPKWQQKCISIHISH